jgi:beta-fructofuranosidase
MKAGSARRIGLKVRCTPDGTEETPIIIDRDANTLRIDLAQSSADESVVYHARCLTPLDHNYTVTEQVAPFELAPDEDLDLRVFLDHSIIEVYANGRQCVTQRIYPTRNDSHGITFFAEGGDAALTSLEAWDIAPTVPW